MNWHNEIFGFTERFIRMEKERENGKWSGRGEKKKVGKKKERVGRQGGREDRTNEGGKEGREKRF